MIEIETVKSSITPTVDRPDVIKREAKKNLTFKEVKETFFKFLFQVGIPFTAGEKLTITTEIEDKNFGEVYSHNAAYYNSACRLEGITVNKKPIYVIVLNSNYDSLEKRQKNKLITLRRNNNIVIFDKQDWGSFSLDIVDRQWLSALNKKILRRWAKSLFEKIGELKGDVKAKYTLNDINENIEKLGLKEDSKTHIQKLIEENKELKYQLRLQLLSNAFEIKPSHNVIVRALSQLNEASAFWCECILDSLVGLFKNKKHEFSIFGTYNYITKNLHKTFKDIEIAQQVTSEALFIKIKNLKTFQEMYVRLAINNNLRIDKTALAGLPETLIYNFLLTYDKNSEKINKINGSILLSSYFSSDNHKYISFNNTIQLPIYESGVDKNYSLCLPKLNNQ